MEKREIKKLQEYIKKRYTDVNMDYQTFNLDLDETLTYAEQKEIYDNALKELLPSTKKETNITLQQFKQMREEEIRKEQEKTEEEIKLRLEKEIEKITEDSKELEKIYYTPREYIKMVAQKKAKGLLLYGESSLGKSYNVKKVLKDLDIKDSFFVSGHITPMKFYEKLYQAKDSLVVFDDVDILGNQIVLNMIKASLNENSGNVVEYHTTKRMDIPNSFIFNGNVIILLNDIPKRNEHLKAVESRVLKYHLKFSREEILKIIFEIVHKQEIEGIDLKEKLEIANWIKENTDLSTKNLNIRLYLQAVEFYKWNKGNWKELTDKQIIRDEYSMLVLQGISDDDWVLQTGLSKSTKDRVRREMGLTRAYRK